MKNQKYQEESLVDESFSSSKEYFLVNYLNSFNRGIERKWQTQHLSIFE